MPTVLLPDYAKKLGLTLDLDDVAPTITTCLERLPDGTLEEPSVLEIPESYRCVETIAPRAPKARYRHLYCAQAAELRWPTLGPGHDGNLQVVVDAAADTVAGRTLRLELEEKYRNRSLYAPIGGYGWKYRGTIRGPHEAGLPAGSPGSCLEAQHGINPKDVGYDLTPELIDAGHYGVQICASILDVWGDYISPSTTIPNGVPCREIHAFGGRWDGAGRMAFLVSNVRGWSMRYVEVGARTRSSIIHSETGGGTRLIGGGVVADCKVRGGKNFFHISGNVAEFVGLLITRNERWDQEIGGRISGGPRLALGLGRARVRDIVVTENLHHRHVDGQFLGDYLRVDGINHTRNVGPYRRGFPLSSQLRARDCRSATLAPNLYTNT